MVDTFIETLEYFPRGLVYVALGIVVLYIAKWILDFVTPYHVGDQLGKKDNTALGLSITGYFLGVIIVFVAVLYTPLTSGEEFQWEFDAGFGYDVLEVFLYSLGAIAVLNLTRFLVDRLVLFKFNVEKEVIEDQNAGTGAVEFAIYIAGAPSRQAYSMRSFARSRSSCWEWWCSSCTRSSTRSSPPTMSTTRSRRTMSPWGLRWRPT